MKQVNNKGFTLVELLVVVTLSALLSASLAYFIQCCTRGVKKAQDDITLQMEAQAITNQLSNLIIEANNVKYEVNILTIYHTQEKYILSLEETNHKLMYEKILEGEVASGDKKLFGRYITNLSVVDTGDNDSNRNIKISFDLKKNNSSYSVQDHLVTLRNRIKVVSGLD